MKEILILIETNFEQNFLHVFHTFWRIFGEFLPLDRIRYQPVASSGH